MKTSSELERSPCAILLYAYAALNLGACIGYVTSASVCFSLKFYVTLVLLVAVTALVLVVELINCLRQSQQRKRRRQRRRNQLQQQRQTRPKYG
jgi:hypothetical protein